MSPIKAGWSRKNVFSQGWVDGLRAAMEHVMSATIEIYFLSTGGLEYDPETGEYTYPEAKEVIYAGPARVQPIRASRNIPNNASDTEVQAVRFQVPEPALSVRPKHRIRVLEADLNPALANFEYVVQGVMNASNPFETSIEAQVDTEVEVSYDPRTEE